jgi:dynein light intermediate chain 1
VPPNWDSWGKIRILREGFDVEAVSKGWALDIEESPSPSPSSPQPNGHGTGTSTALPSSALALYALSIRDPSLDALAAPSTDTVLEVSSLDPQTFLGTQLVVIEKLKLETSGMDGGRLARGRVVSPSTEVEEEGEGRVSEHIGPVQFNMGGIQVDADDMLQRLKVCFFFFYLPLTPLPPPPPLLTFGDHTLTHTRRTAKVTKRPNPPRPAAAAAQQATARRRITRRWLRSLQGL